MPFLKMGLWQAKDNPSIAFHCSIVYSLDRPLRGDNSCGVGPMGRKHCRDARACKAWEPRSRLGRSTRLFYFSRIVSTREEKCLPLVSLCL